MAEGKLDWVIKGKAHKKPTSQVSVGELERLGEEAKKKDLELHIKAHPDGSIIATPVKIVVEGMPAPIKES